MADYVITVGDFNARTGTMAPRVGDTQLQRVSVDTTICPRAKWFVDLCELTEVHILNGEASRQPAPYTCHATAGKSAVDYVLSSHHNMGVEYDELTLEGYTDHTLLWVSMPVAVVPPSPQLHRQPPAATSYRWDVGPSIDDQVAGIKRWKEHTDSFEF